MAVTYDEDKNLYYARCEDCNEDFGGWVSEFKALKVLRRHEYNSPNCKAPLPTTPPKEEERPKTVWEAHCPCGDTMKGRTKKAATKELHTHFNENGCINNAIDSEVVKVEP